MHNTTADYSYVKMELMLDFLPAFLQDYFEDMEYHPWIFSALASILIGLSGILPLIIIPDYDPNKLKDGEKVSEFGSVSLKTALSFAVGGMLGDVFLHLLPETWGAHRERGHVSMRCGLWVLFGMLVFIIVEKLFAGNDEGDDEDNGESEKSPILNRDLAETLSAKNLEIEDLYNAVEKESDKRVRSGLSLSDGSALPDCNGDTRLLSGCLFNSSLDGGGLCSQNTCNGILADGVSKGRCLMGNRWMGRCILRDHKPSLKMNSQELQRNNNNATDKAETATPAKSKQVSGYLNLMANSIDNFTHGLAVGGSFIVSLRVGLLTTFAILVHEIPHEVGDFAILLNSGFSRWEAAKAQLATASAGLVGAMTAVIFSGAKNAIEAKTSWIVPFTAGGFLHIALVTVLPDLLSEPDPKQAVKQLAALLTGAAIMGAITVYVE